MTTRLYGSGFVCVIISRTILNPMIWRYHIPFFKNLQVLNDVFTMINELFLIL
jgi:hypothetical protein